MNTPKTDDYIRSKLPSGAFNPRYVEADFARTLECELNEANAKVERLTRELERINEIYIDGDDTHDDWRAMGEIATEALENGENFQPNLSFHFTSS